MKIAAMQPYLFPYLGYFQLIDSVDRFVVLDDVQWINRGWINRNRCLGRGQPQPFRLPVAAASSRLNINQRLFASDVDRHKRRMLRQIRHTYGKAPHFEPVYALISACLANPADNVAAFVADSLRLSCAYLRITTPFILSSSLDGHDALTGQERILDINRALGSGHYINPVGGVELYDKASFAGRGIRLSFLRTRNIGYRQFGGPFLPDLSIIDVMMFNSADEIAGLLEEYDLE